MFFIGYSHRYAASIVDSYDDNDNDCNDGVKNADSILWNYYCDFNLYWFIIIGFEWRLRDHTHKQQVVEDKFTQVFEALNLYKQLVDESMQMPTSYVVPTDDNNWPEELRGLRLGTLVQGT